MTIIFHTAADGKTRRCTAQCYNATGKKCRCICGGRNHGVGLGEAIIQSVNWLKAWSLDYPGPEYAMAKNLQLPLFKDRRVYESKRTKVVTPRVTPPQAAPVPVK